MNYQLIGSYPSQLTDEQLRSYICVLLNVADVDGISESEMKLIEDMAATASVTEELLAECKMSYKSYDLAALPDYHKSWAYCILRDAVVIADCDNDVSAAEMERLKAIASFADVSEEQFNLVKDLTLQQLRISDQWNSLLS